MNEKLFVLANQKKTTSHILHLLLCFPTCGAWLVVWAVIAGSNNRHNAHIQKQMNKVVDYKRRGLSDREIYRQVDADEAAHIIRSDLIFLAASIAVTIGLYFLIK